MRQYAPARAPVTPVRIGHIVQEGLRTPSAPLAAENQGSLAKRFQFDFANVRVHSGPQSAESARSLGARAYTSGEHIVSAYDLGHTAAPTPLLIHELSHVVQQARKSNADQHQLAGSPVPLQRDSDPALAQPAVALNVGSMSKGEKLIEIIKRTGRELGPEFSAKLQALLSPESIATMVAFGTAWVVAQFFGVGEVADLVLGVAGAAMLGPEIATVLKDGYDFFKFGLYASSEADLDKAGHALAQLLVIVGVDVAIALLLHQGMKKAGPGIRAAGESARAPVTPEGFRVPVPDQGPVPNDPMQSQGSGGKGMVEDASKGSGEKAGPEGTKPKLETNPKHHPNSASPEPANAQELFDKSIVDENGVRWAKDSNGVIHRFSKPSNGVSHWNGSTAGSDPIATQNIPSAIRKALK